VSDGEFALSVGVRIKFGLRVRIQTHHFTKTRILINIVVFRDPAQSVVVLLNFLLGLCLNVVFDSGGCLLFRLFVISRE